jgi:ATP-dependent 26S proteasome regulatory subunit
LENSDNRESENEGPSGDAPEPTVIDGRYTIDRDVWTRLRLSVRAGFTIPSPQYVNDPATEKSHILLQYPHRRNEANIDVIGGSLFLHAVVQSLAKHEKADLVTLNAQDIARLCSEQARAEGKASSSIRNLGYEIYNTWNKKRRLDMEPPSDKEEARDDGDASISVSGSNIRPHIVPIEVTLPDTQLPNWLLSSFGAGTDSTRASRSETGAWTRVINQLTSISSQNQPTPSDSTATPNTETEKKSESLPKTIIHIQDYVELMHTREGSKFLKLLLDAIHSHRRLGHRILLIGTSSGYRDLYFDREMSPLPIVEQTRLYLDSSARPFASPIAVFPSMDPKELNVKFAEDRRSRIRDINIRHLQDMLHLRVDSDTTPIDGSIFDIASWPDDIDAGTSNFGLNNDYLGYTRVHNLSSMIMGAVQANEKLSFEHIRLAFIAETKHRRSCENWYSPSRSSGPTAWGTNEKQMTSELDEGLRVSKLDTISQLECNKYEKKLLGGVVDADSIRTTFSDVHVPSETVEALKTLTSLSLKRPDAFTYGVLASDKIPGMLLYGPPGTGKTLLAKAVARESGATVLEVSGSDIYDMYVGEGEKNVRAIFTLAKKLSPCVVFIDEADAIFGSRNQSRNRFSSHRELINQFLREWDGMNEMSAFIMVATNRPFDLDDAVLRRLPRRLLVDLPIEQDREAILKIHLKNEQLDPSVDLADLAHRTPFYSGSDLKNVCVAAALTCVREEYENRTQHTGDTPYQYPEQRTLTQAHFERAMEEISASISEDMSSLDEIRKFDEKFGDRKARRKRKASWGFMPLNDTQAPLDTTRVRT